MSCGAKEAIKTIAVSFRSKKECYTLAFKLATLLTVRELAKTICCLHRPQGSMYARKPSVDHMCSIYKYYSPKC